ncbi:MAG TPA: aldose epimerase family protein [Victivallales bacterium]|nr:aldose epimerase family protein [Victivallales bacterium]
MKVTKSTFGCVPSGREVYKYTLSNDNTISIDIITYGGIITSLKVPNKKSELTDIVLGFDNLDAYLTKHPYFGALAGRHAGRIKNAEFSIENKTYHLIKNSNGVDHIHGGAFGLDKVLWESESFETENSAGIKLSYFSKDMEEGYPGNLNIEVKYVLNINNELSIIYSAKTDKKTPLVLTNHTYFNLNGEESGSDILNNKLRINADNFLALGENSIPTGEIINVKNTPMDFLNLTAIGDRINDDFDQLILCGGYDHPWLLNNTSKTMTAISESTGIKLDVITDQAVVVCYTGNSLDNSITGKSGVKYAKNYGFCLETQGPPDAVHHPNFPNVIISPEKPFAQNTTWKFSVI